MSAFSALPNIGKFVKIAFEVANAFVSTLRTSPVVVTREVFCGSGYALTLTGRATFAVAIQFRHVVRAHFSRRSKRGYRNG